jgi:uncharacterized protein (DUF305 family)
MSPATAQDAHHHEGAKAPTGIEPFRGSGAFIAENDEAMERMMTAMHVSPTGDVDHDFVAMMIPHHQGAIDMARADSRLSFVFD